MVNKAVVLSMVLVLLAGGPVLAQSDSEGGGQNDPTNQQMNDLDFDRADPNGSLQSMTVTPTMIPTQPGMATPPGATGNAGYEDITNVTMEEGSPDISTSVPGGRAVGQPQVEWSFAREGESFGGSNSNLNSSPMTMEANTDGPNGEGLYTMPQPGDSLCGTTPCWKPGRYTVGNHSVRRVEYEAEDADTGEPTTARTTVESVGSADIVIYDTTPPALKLMLRQESSDAVGEVNLEEARAASGEDMPIEDGTVHSAILKARGTGFDERLADEGSFSFPVTVKMGDNDIADVGEFLEEIADGSNDPILVEARTFGFHVFEDTPLKVVVRAADNFSDYKKAIKFMAALVDAAGNPYRDANGEEIKWDQTLSDKTDSEGEPLADDAAAGSEFFTRTIDLPFYTPESSGGLYEMKANYPLRSMEPDETQLGELCTQTGVFLLLEGADDNGCYPAGMSSNLARLKVPIYVHDITPVCEGGTGLTVTFSGRHIEDTISIIEDPEAINHDTADGPKSVKFIVHGAHIVTEEYRDEDFTTSWTETLHFDEEDIVSRTDFENLAELGSSYGLKQALMIPQNTRLQISVACNDNYTISTVTEDTELEVELPDETGNRSLQRFVHWEVDGMQELDTSALDSPSMVNFKFANYREGVGFITPRRYEYTFKLECRDKAGNEIKFTLPIYVLDTKYQVRHIMEGSVND